MIKEFADASASIGKAVLILALPVYLAIDATRLWVSEGYRAHREARQAALCFDFYDEENNRGDPVAEATRQENLPRSLFGKLDLFLQCATITEIGLGGFKLERAEQAQIAALEAANAAGAQAVAEAYMAELERGSFLNGIVENGFPEPVIGAIPWVPIGDGTAVIQNGFGNSSGADVPVTGADPSMRRVLETALDEAVRSAIESFDPEAILQNPAFNAFDAPVDPDAPG